MHGSAITVIRHCFRNIVTAITLTVGCVAASASDATEGNSNQRPNTIIVLGDSITKGVRTGVSSEQTFATLVQQSLSKNGSAARVINAGIGGERTDQALKRLDQVIKLAGDSQPDLVTVMYGTNDSYVDKGATTSRLTIDEYRQNLEAIVVELLRRGILPVLMTEPRWSESASGNGLGENPNVRLEPFMVACRETAAKWRVPLVDHFAYWTEAGKAGANLHEWTTDGCHPNPLGHQKLAELMLPVLQRVIGPDRKFRQKLLAGQGLRVVCFGDSVTGVYYHTGSRRAYTDMLGIALRQMAPQAKLEMHNAGISGHTTTNALERLDRDVIQLQPDLVTVMFGLNDMTRVPLETYRENLKTIVERCRAAGSEVILATPNNVITTNDRPSEKLMQYCDVIRQLGSELNVAVCDVYRELDAVRQQAPADWRLLMSDAIHPNMAGHKSIATCLAQSITGQRADLGNVPVPADPIRHTLKLLSDGQPVRILAMPPYDQSVAQVLRASYPKADITVEVWPTENLMLKDIEEAAKTRVRALKPDLVVIAVPRSASVATDSDEAFASSFAWVMNWSLNFGSPTWDVVVVHPSVSSVSKQSSRDDLIRRLVNAQDLSLIDRPVGSQTSQEEVLQKWFQASGQ